MATAMISFDLKLDYEQYHFTCMISANAAATSLTPIPTIKRINCVNDTLMFVLDVSNIQPNIRYIVSSFLNCNHPITNRENIEVQDTTLGTVIANHSEHICFFDRKNFRRH